MTKGLLIALITLIGGGYLLIFKKKKWIKQCTILLVASFVEL